MFTFFEDFVEGADFYRHKGSLWLIFTDQKKWVFELSKEGVLWYNYYFFEKIFKFFSMDLIENQKFITEWAEDTIQNEVKHTRGLKFQQFVFAEDTIQNGVKHTQAGNGFIDFEAEDTIQNGVKKTTPGGYLGFVSKKGKKIHQFESPKQNNEVEDTIQNGVKETYMEEHHRLREVVQTVKNGVKETNWRCVDNHPTFVDSVIESGIKEIWGYEKQSQTRVSEVIRNGVKEDLS